MTHYNITNYIDNKQYAYQVYRRKISENLAIFSASLSHPIYFQVSKFVDALRNSQELEKKISCFYRS